MIGDILCAGFLLCLGLALLVCGFLMRDGRLGREGWLFDGVIEEILPDGSFRVRFAVEGEEVVGDYKPIYLYLGAAVHMPNPPVGLRVIVVTQFKDPREIRRVQLRRRKGGTGKRMYCHGSSRDFRRLMLGLGGFFTLLGGLSLCIVLEII